ncbi:S8 family serine peptidase [Streptomyces sp. NPDC005805]|uniref:S8 family serine peptidase n=1 Tax=Streptomyces sp. NPDC005805 TaxID=3157068 RepID=UPI0033C40D70
MKAKAFAFLGLRRGVLATVTAATISLGTIGFAPPAAADDMRSKQWYLDAMHVDKIWKKAQGEGITVAVIDSGVNRNTASLKGQVLKGKDLTGSDGDEFTDFKGHGTTMAELIAGTGAGGGIQGLAPKAKIIPYRVSEHLTPGEKNENAFDYREAMEAAINSDARIINISSGSEYYVSAYRKLFQQAQQKGKLVFAAAGNDGDGKNKRHYPAAYPEAVAVAATNPDGKVEEYSQHGDYIDLAAPAGNLPRWCDNTFSRYCMGEGGTSSSAAIASASAALIWSANPDWTANQVLRVMLESAARSDGWKPGSVSRYLGHGIVRPGAHINRGIGKPGDPNISPLTNLPTNDTEAPDSDKSPAAEGSEGSGSSGDKASAAPDGTDTPAKDGSAPGEAASASDAESSSSNGALWGIGAVGVLAVVAGAGYAVARKRRGA